MQNSFRTFGVSFLTRIFLLAVVGASIALPMMGCGNSKPAEVTTPPKDAEAKQAAIIKQAQDEKSPDAK